jgi:hypothetical protein
MIKLTVHSDCQDVKITLQFVGLKKILCRKFWHILECDTNQFYFKNNDREMRHFFSIVFFPATLVNLT